jgi:exopolysaccharide biosynthesis polyprenyl glycosylphosphotransferase
VNVRARLQWYSLALDVLLAVLCYELALVVFVSYHSGGLTFAVQSFDWGLPLAVAAIVVTFTRLGLYKLEAYVARPLHLVTLLKGSVVALVVTAFFAFLFKSPLVGESRLTLSLTFALFFVASAVARIALLDRVYVADVRARRGGSIVIGASAGSSVTASRCGDLRGYAPVLALEPLDRRRNGFDAEPELLRALGTAEPAPRQVFLDAAALGHKAVFDLIGAARARGAEVYVIGRLVGPLDSTRLLMRLFEMPLMCVSGTPAAGEGVAVSKRAFDVVTSAAALLLLSPVLAVVALLIKRGSPGPVFYRQTRIGLRGRPFEFLKFRSMAVGNDGGEHREYVRRLIECGSAAGGDPALCTADEFGRTVFKLVGDARVTRIGRVLRKYSLDELPQFWNVLRGDMSMIGPRPALEYEVAAYKPWHRRRLEVAPGVSGLWQVAGRSRVGFDEMVFQDVMYCYNQSLLTDLSLCLRTVPAVLIGRGAA